MKCFQSSHLKLKKSVVDKCDDIQASNLIDCEQQQLNLEPEENQIKTTVVSKLEPALSSINDIPGTTKKIQCNFSNDLSDIAIKDNPSPVIPYNDSVSNGSNDETRWVWWKGKFGNADDNHHWFLDRGGRKVAHKVFYSYDYHLSLSTSIYIYKSHKLKAFGDSSKHLFRTSYFVNS